MLHNLGNDMTNQTIHLQGIGQVAAKPAAEIAAGDTLVFNYGYTYTVKGIYKVTAKTVTLILVNVSRSEFTQRFGKNTLVGIKEGN